MANRDVWMFKKTSVTIYEFWLMDRWQHTRDVTNLVQLVHKRLINPPAIEQFIQLPMTIIWDAISPMFEAIRLGEEERGEVETQEQQNMREFLEEWDPGRKGRKM